MLSRRLGVSAPMRIDLEQFLAYTMILGTAGAIGIAVYTKATDEPPADADEPAAVIDQADAEPVAAAPSVPVAPPVATTPDEPPPIVPDADFDKEPDPDLPDPTFEGT